MLHRASRYTLALGFLMLPAIAGAQAFGLNEIGSCAIARGFAVTSAPCADGSSIYWNPGAMTRQGLTISAGATAIALKGDFTRDTSFKRYESDIPTAIVPHVFLNYGSGSMAYGVGVYVPYGLTSQWGDDFPGRFSAKKASLQTVYVQPNIAYQITPNWSIGGGPVIGHSTVELVQGIDLATTGTTTAGVTFGMLGIPKYTEFARATLKGSAMGYGVHLGFLGKVTPEWSLGGRFLSQVTFSYNDADATFEQKTTGLTLAAGNVIIPGGASAPVDVVLASQFASGGALTAQKVATQITHPAQAQVGLTYTGFQNTSVSFEYAYTGWKSFKQLPVNFQGAAKASSKILQEDYNNTSALRFGIEHKTASGVALRGGFTAAASAAPAETVTPLLPEQDRELGMLGVGLPLMGALSVDASYAHIFTPGSRGRIDERATGSTTAQGIALNSGVYTLNANIFSVTFKYSH